MLVANPIYDITFKRIMENNNIAKFLLSTILKCEILNLEATSTEYIAKAKEPLHFTVTRLDFAAKILTKDEGEKEVLIEVQKVKHPSDIMRFRRYLGLKYQNSKLPLVTVYFLGYKLDDIDTPASIFSVGGHDLLTNKVIHTQNDFVKFLTHTSYIIQVPRINSNEKTMLDKLLTLFDQKSAIKETPYIMDLKLKKIDPELKDMVNVLQLIVADKKMRAKLEKEEKENQIIEDLFEIQERLLAEKDNVIRESMKTIQEKDDVIRENKKIMKENEIAIKEKDETIKEKDEIVYTTVRNMNQTGMSVHQISKLTGIGAKEIEKILKK